MGIAIIRAHARRPKLPSLVINPLVEVLGGEGRGGRHARRARRRRDIDDVAFRHRDEIAKGRNRELAIAQHALVDEGKAPQVIERLDLLRAHLRGVKGGAVVRRAGIGVREMRLQEAQLEAVPVSALLRFEMRVPIRAIVGRRLGQHGRNNRAGCLRHQ